jgi:hypothetical protein
MTAKTQKELAFLQDLYIATDWGERFAELVDEHVKLPKEGCALYIEAGTGEHALALQTRAGKKLQLVCAGPDGCRILDRHRRVRLRIRRTVPEFALDNGLSLTELARTDPRGRSAEGGG